MRGREKYILTELQPLLIKLHLLITYTPYILGQRPVSCGLIDDLSYLKKIRPSKQQMFEEIR